VPCCRDSEASAPPEYPPEQPEADLVADEEEYGAEELAEEEEAEVEGAEANGEETVDKDAQMEGVEGLEGENVVDEEELSDEGSVDIEGESEDELEEYEAGEGEGEGADDEMMDVDDKPEHAAEHKQEAMVH
jgi:histone chaperone ASF1